MRLANKSLQRMKKEDLKFKASLGSILKADIVSTCL